MRFLFFILILLSFQVLAEDSGNSPCPKEKIKEFHESCKKGKNDSCFWNAICLGREAGDSQTKIKSFIEGVKLLTKLCNSKYRLDKDKPSACEIKAAYESDISALKTLPKNCDSGIINACLQLLTDIDSIKQPDLHFKYSKKLCDLKDNDGCFQLAFNYYYLKNDTKQGIKIMTDLCQKKHGTSCKELEEYKSSLTVKPTEQNLDIGGTAPCTKEVISTATNLCKSNDQYGCFAQAVCLSKDGMGRVRYDNTVKANKILSKLCIAKYRISVDVPTACEFKAAYEKDLPGMKAGFQNEEKVAKDEKEYQQIISSWNSLNTIEKMSGALKKLDRLCAINHSNSCENRDILKTSIGAFRKDQRTSQPNATTTQAEPLQQKIIDDQNSKCEKDGHGETCWNLYLANKNEPYWAGRFLKAGCSVGHEKSCLVKRTFDEEQRQKAETQERAVEYLKNDMALREEARRQETQKWQCFNWNKGYNGWLCKEGCPGYQECLVENRKQEEMFKPKKSTSCRSDLMGGFRCTED